MGPEKVRSIMLEKRFLCRRMPLEGAEIMHQVSRSIIKFVERMGSNQYGLKIASFKC